MDATDFMILRKLTWKPYDPFDARRKVSSVWDIARELEMHGSTVKRRLARMRETGILQGLCLYPAPQIMGIRCGLYEFTFQSAHEKRLGMSHLETRWAREDTPGVTDLFTFVGNYGWVGLVGPRDCNLGEFAETLRSESGATRAELIDPLDWPCDVSAVSALDRRILHALHLDVLRPLAEVAESVGVTPRTVRNRMHRLARAAAFCIVPIFMPSKIQGLIPFYMIVTTEEDIAPKAVLGHFPDALDKCARPLKPFLLLGATDSSEVDEAIIRAEAIPGVTSVEVRMIETSKFAPVDLPYTPIESLIQESIPAASASRRRSGVLLADREEA